MGTLAVGLGCFPFDRETYLTRSDSRTHLFGILSLIRVGRLSSPSLFSALPPINISKASPKAISGRTSYLRVRLAFHPYPHVIRQLFNGGRFGPPVGFTPPSTCTWIGHPVSGLIHATLRALHTRFPFDSVPSVLNLAAYINSPDRSTKSTTSHLNVLCVLVNIRFQVLFHSPPGVLFTFPSQYCSSIGHQVVFRLGGWAPQLPTGFLVSRGTLDPDQRIPRVRWYFGSCRSVSRFAYGVLTLFDRPSHAVRLRSSVTFAVHNPGCIATPGLASSAFARHYSRNLV